jgi:HK97 family phage major capsid protein
MNPAALARHAAEQEANRLTERFQALEQIRATRALNSDERAELDRIQADVAALQERADELNQQRSGYDPAAFSSGAPASEGLARQAVLRRGDSMTDWLRARGRSNGWSDQDVQDFSLGRAIRGMVTGQWAGARLEQRALAEGSDAAGGFLTPEILSGPVIDRLRNATRVMEAGATVVPVLSDQHAIPRLATGVTPGWRAENAAVAESDATFERVTFRPKTLAVLVRLSYELFEDLAPESSAMIDNEIIQALALELDRVSLTGTGTSNQPRGIRNQSGVTIDAAYGVNGSTPNTWLPLVRAVAGLRGRNSDATAMLMAPRTAGSFASLADSTGQTMPPPAYLENIPQLETSQIPTNLTQGTSTDCSDIYLGRWADLLIGLRGGIGVRLQRLNERYADQMQVGLLAWVRADVQLSHPESFTVLPGIRP